MMVLDVMKKLNKKYGRKIGWIAAEYLAAITEDREENEDEEDGEENYEEY